MDKQFKPISSEFVSPKVEERKLRAGNDWAKLVNYQQSLAEKMVQQEKELRNLQKLEFKKELTKLENVKEKNRQLEKHEREEIYTKAKEKEQEFDQYKLKVKNDKANLQQIFADELGQERWLREEEQKRKLEQEKKVERKILDDALEGLEREKTNKHRRKHDYMQSVSEYLQEREAIKAKEKEKAEYDRREYNKSVNERDRELAMKDINYRLYYEKVANQQDNRLRAHEQRVTELEKSKSKQIDDFIQNSMDEVRKRAEEEENKRRLQRREQTKSMVDTMKLQMQERQEEQIKQKLAHQERMQELKKKQEEEAQLDKEIKIYSAYQVASYKDSLASQVKEAKEVKRRMESEMPEHERRMHLNNFSNRLIPGIKNTPKDLDNFPTIKARPTERISTDPFSSPYVSPKYNQSYSIRKPNYDAKSSFTDEKFTVNNVSFNPPNATEDWRNTHHNPITNPISVTVQNPYIRKTLIANSPQNKLKNILASAADNNLVYISH